MLVSPQLVDTQHLKLYNTDMKKLLISSAVVLSLLMVGAGAFVFYVGNMPDEVVATQTVEPESKPPTVDELLRLVNEERAKVGVTALVLDENMNTTAQWKADDMHSRDYFSHWPETMDGKPNTEKYTVNLEMRKLLDASCTESSENIRDNDEYINTSAEAVRAWAMSPAHYKAMTDARYSKTGFGIHGDRIIEHFCVAK